MAAQTRTPQTRTVQIRIIVAAAGLLARSVDGDVSTREICDAAGVTAPTLYHYFRDKEGLLRAVVDFGWTNFLESKRTVAAVVHDQIGDDIRAGWNNHIEFAQKNPNFYRLMWSPAISADTETSSTRLSVATLCGMVMSAPHTLLSLNTSFRNVA